MKYTYYFVIKANFGSGWADLEHIDKHEDHELSFMHVDTGKWIKKPVSAHRYARWLAGEHRMNFSYADYKIVSRRKLNK